MKLVETDPRFLASIKKFHLIKINDLHAYKSCSGSEEWIEYFVQAGRQCSIKRREVPERPLFLLVAHTRPQKGK